MSPNLETIFARQIRLLMPGEVANLLGIKPKTLEAWRAAGEGPPHVIIGRRNVRYDPGDLAVWIKERRQPDNPSPTEGAA